MTGVEGGAFCILLPLSSIKALTLPNVAPATNGSCIFRVPSWMMRVPNGPWPLSRPDSMMMPFASLSGFAFKLEQLRLQKDQLEKLLDAGLLFCRYLGRQRRSAPFFRLETQLAELLHHLVGIRVRLVDLVHRHDDRNVRRPCVVYGLPRLGHDPIVGSHDQNDDIRDQGAPRPHRSEGFVAGRIDEGNLLAVDAGHIGADVLRDASGFMSRHISYFLSYREGASCRGRRDP